MARGKKRGILIAGGGLAGSLAALAMAKLRPEVPLTLIGEEGSPGGGQGWTFFDAELSEEGVTLVEPLVSHNWPGFYASFPGGSRKLKAACAIIAAERVDAALRETLGDESYRLSAKIVAVRDDGVILQGGEMIAAEGAIDAREPANLSLLELGWRRFAARDYAFAAPHRVDRPVMVDAATGVGGGFAACLPFSETAMRVAHFDFARRSDGLDAAEARIAAYVAQRGWRGGRMSAEEIGAAPLALGGDFPTFWRIGGARVAKIGPRGGYFHPATGSPLGDAVRTALLLTRQRDFSGPALHDLFERDAAEAWNRRDFYRGFNALLLADPGRVLEAFLALDPALIFRFQAERLGLLDRRRIMKAVGR